MPSVIIIFCRIVAVAVAVNVVIVVSASATDTAAAATAATIVGEAEVAVAIVYRWKFNGSKLPINFKNTANWNGTNIFDENYISETKKKYK